MFTDKEIEYFVFTTCVHCDEIKVWGVAKKV